MQLNSLHMSFILHVIAGTEVYNNYHYYYHRYGDGVSWHDSACYRTKQFVCEDSDKMVVTMIDDEDDHGGDVDSDKMVVMMIMVTTKMMMVVMLIMLI